MVTFGRLMVVALTLLGSRALAAPPAPIGAPLDLSSISSRTATRALAAKAARAPAAPRAHWTLPHRPSVHGDLALPLGSSRFEVLGETSSGLHLRRRATGADFVYAGALLTDASGAETRIPAVQQDGELVVVVPEQLLDSVAYPVVLDPDIGPALDVPAANGQAAAFDGTNYLLAWSSGGNIWAARVSPQGALLDPSGILVGQGSAADGQLSVAFTGGVYLVSWVERTDKTYTNATGLTFTGPTSHFYYTLVDPLGQVLGSAGRLITDDEFCTDLVCASDDVGVSVAQDGADFLVFGNNYNYTLAAQIAPTGDLVALTRTPWPAVTEFSFVRNASIAFDGTNYAVVALDANSSLIIGERLTPAGQFLDPQWTTVFDPGYVPFMFPDRYPRTSIAFGTDSFLATWTSAWSQSSVYATRLSRTGAVLDPAGILLAHDLPTGSSTATVFDGCSFVAASGDQAVRVSSDGAILDSTPWTLAGPVTAMATDELGTVLVVSGTHAQLVRTCGTAATNPVFAPPPSPVAEATGPQGATVTFQVTAHNENGPAIVTCTPTSGSLFPLGATSVSCTAVDPNDHALTSSAAFDVLVHDTTPPTVLAPPNVVAPATGPNGAAVAFTVVATDLVDPSPVVTCSRPSGSVFPVGATTVSCSATDSSGNVSATVTFTVSIQGAGQQIAELIGLINSFRLRSTISSTLVLVLQAAGSNAGSCTSACTLMSAFTTATSFARLTGAVSPAQAAQLTTAAKRIRSALGCGRMCGI